MDDELLREGLGGMTSGASARGPNRQQPQHDHLQSKLRALHAAYAGDADLPDHLVKLARRLSDAYVSLEAEDAKGGLSHQKD